MKALLALSDQSRFHSSRGRLASFLGKGIAHRSAMSCLVLDVDELHTHPAEDLFHGQRREEEHMLVVDLVVGAQSDDISQVGILEDEHTIRL